MPEPVAFKFDAKNPAAQKVAKKQAAKLVTNVTLETKQAIRSVIVRSIREGIPPYDAARMIRSMVGMNEPQGMAAMNYRARLIDSGLPIERVNVLSDRYVKKKIRERGKTIARTELITSLNRGQQESWKQAQKKKFLSPIATKEVIVTPDEILAKCPVCSPFEYADPIPINEPFETINGAFMSPAFHPR